MSEPRTPALTNFPPDDVILDAIRGRILVIDDEADIRESLEALLTLEGYQVVLASTANEGIERVESAQYDLVLLDLMLPDKSGIEVITELRERDNETPIFLITAYGWLATGKGF